MRHQHIETMCAERIKLLVMSGGWPYLVGAPRGVDVVLYEIVRILAAESDFEVAYAMAGTHEPSLSRLAQAGVDDLAAAGVRFFPPIRLSESASRSFLSRNCQRLLGDDLIPGTGQHEQIIAACRRENWIPDIVLTVWSDIVTAAAAGLPWPVLAYSGNPYHKVLLANLALQWRWQRRWNPSWLMRHAFDRFLVRRVERSNLASMRRLKFVGDVHANDASYYRSMGVEAHYLRSMWPGTENSDWRVRRDAAEQLSPLKIVASVGAVPSTGNTFGLWTLGEEILPALKQKLGSDCFELHVYGSGKPRSFLVPLLDDRAIKLRGFVEDIDAEICSSPIYLVANNRLSYKAGHNRFLHAWSLGACIVTWRDSALAMPELVDDENVLLADTADEMAALIQRAASDVQLRRRLGEAGRSTVLKYYQPNTVVAEMTQWVRTSKAMPVAGSLPTRVPPP